MARSRLAFGFGLVALLGVGACANLLGLDKFVDCAEDSGLCSPAVTDADLPDTNLPDSAVDGGADAPPVPDGSAAAQWAKWRVPYYNGGLVDSGSVMDATNIASGTVQGSLGNAGFFDGGVFVTLSVPTNGIIGTWLRTKGQVIQGTFEGAQQYCRGLGGRVPTRIELLMLLDSTQVQHLSDGGTRRFMMRPEVYETDLDSGPLPNNATTGYWSSTVVRTDGAVDYWIVDFKEGTVSRSASNNWGVLCIKSPNP